jgi:hypothetical protein
MPRLTHRHIDRLTISVCLGGRLVIEDPTNNLAFGDDRRRLRQQLRSCAPPADAHFSAKDEDDCLSLQTRDDIKEFPAAAR